MTAQPFVISGHEIELSNLDKVLFPKSGLTKGNLVEHYRRIAEIALPHYRDRPLSMHRFPDGIEGEGFFQKNLPGYFPDWIDRVDLRKEGGMVTYVIANNAATLVYLANQACITPHLSLARQDRPDHPDRLIFDLDPSDDDFGKVQDASKRLRALLEELALTSFVQSTGSRGLHVVVPLDRSASFDAARGFARALADCLAERYPDLLTVEQRKSKRGQRVFLDYLRNAYGQTAVAPYAVRAIEGAPVATPLKWEEVGSRDLSPRKYTIRNIFRRLAQTGDPWSDIARRAHSLGAAQERLARIDRRPA
ncbi:MAG: non-homologous end-joining DNA ligase [Kiloniellales bacterium]